MVPLMATISGWFRQKLGIGIGILYAAGGIGAAIAADAVNTPWHCMRERAKINPHDDVLIVGAGGGVGIHGVQVA